MISGKLTFPPRRLLDRKGWKAVFARVEKDAMGAGGILEEHLNRQEVQRPLAESTRRRKARQGLPSTALVGKKGRIVKALGSVTSPYRRRQVMKSRKGGMCFRVYFNPARFRIKGSKDTWTRVLQRGRLRGFRGKSGVIAQGAAARRMAKAGVTGDGVEAMRMEARPVMQYYEGDEGSLTPALVSGVNDELRRSGR